MLQSSKLLHLWVSVCTESIQFLRFWLWTSFFISRSSPVILGSPGCFFKFHLFSESFAASLGKLATNILLCEICFPATAFMAFLKVFPAWQTFVGLCCFFSFSSMSSLKFGQSALRKLKSLCCVRWDHRWWKDILVNGLSLMRTPYASRCSLLCLSWQDWCPGCFTRISYSCADFFAEYYMIRDIVNCNIVSSCVFR